jgi:hypothetical protein
MHAFLLQFYLSGLSGRRIPAEVLLDTELEDEDPLAETLSQAAGYQVKVSSRMRSERARYCKLATTNAQAALASKLAHQSTQHQRTEALEGILQLPTPLARMECFDISHTQGELTVASCVVFNREGPVFAILTAAFTIFLGIPRLAAKSFVVPLGIYPIGGFSPLYLRTAATVSFRVPSPPLHVITSYLPSLSKMC